MRRIGWIFVVLLGIRTIDAGAQTLPDRPKVEVGGSIGVISARPDENYNSYGDDWYGQGRYAASIGYYWTKHLKTEFEHQRSGEGDLYLQDVVRINGVPYARSVQRYHQLQQSSLRVVWQFRDNAWVHPYVMAGAVLDIERQHSFSPPVYQTGGRDPVLVRSAIDSAHRTELRGGWTLGGGAKFYLNERAFFNTGLIGTSSKPAATISVLAGFGIEF